jgi:glyoxylase-like metal-dependent hydrolase (beta-lactamase superfamily II)
MQLEQVSNSTWAVIDGSTYGNVGCIYIPNYLVVIDTGMTPKIAKQFHDQILQTIGSPITHVILTHYHSDHVFGAQEFQQYPLLASSRMVELYPELLKGRWSPKGMEEMRKFYAETEPEFSRQLATIRIITPTEAFSDSYFLGNKNEIEVRHTGGHTAGHSTVFFHPERVLFAGDLVFCQEYPYAGDPTNNPSEWMKAFETILKLPVDTIVPGHGPLCDKEEIRTQLAYFRELKIWLKEQLDKGRTLGEVQQEKENGPKPPYDLKAERRLGPTIERWYHFYSQKPVDSE